MFENWCYISIFSDTVGETEYNDYEVVVFYWILDFYY